MNSRKATLRKFIYEFVVIVVGVLTAFGLQTISESFADNATKKRYLTAIKRELDANIRQFEQLIQRRSNQEDSTKVLVRILSSRQEDADLIRNYMQNFYWLHEMTCKLGSYEALKTSSSFDEVESIDLITRLNNLDAQLAYILAWQTRVQVISIDLFIFRNDDALNLSNYKPEFEKVFSPGYITKIEYLMKTRADLTRDFADLMSEMRQIQKLVDQEME
jgi:hypothetical protein